MDQQPAVPAPALNLDQRDPLSLHSAPAAGRYVLTLKIGDEVSTKLIAYDLNAPGQNYDDLIEAIKGLGEPPWVHRRVWLGHSGLSVAVG